MAGVVKGVQQVVSTSPGLPGPTTQCDALDNYPFPAADVNHKDLLGFEPPSSDGASLQDLIDSELALRISSSADDQLLQNHHDEEGRHLEEERGRGEDDEEDLSEEVDSAELLRLGPAFNNSLITDFLDHERSHSQTDTDSLALASPAPCAQAPLCSGDDSLLGSETADSDFSPNIPLADAEGGVDDPGADDPLADEATLAEDISFTSDRSQERAGSLQDLDPLRPDSPEPREPLPEPEREERGEETGEGKGEGEEGRREAERFRGTEESAQAEPVPVSADATRSPEPGPESEPELLQLEVPVSDEGDAEPVVCAPSPQPGTNPPPACVPVNNSMDVLPASAVPPGAPGSDASFDDGFETWSTVAEAVSGPATEIQAVTMTDSACAAANPEEGSGKSDSETVSETSEKKTSSKKKKIESGDSSSIKKKTRKNKKSEEKENISVLANGHLMNGHIENSNDLSPNNGSKMFPQSNGYADQTVVEDDLSNVCVKDLKSAYTSLTKTEAGKDSHKDLKDIDHDIIYCGPIKNLKQTYCNEASRKCNGYPTPDRKEKIATGISIRDLRRSFGDLRNCENSDLDCQYLPEEELCNDGKARSLGDLRRLSRELYRQGNSENASCTRKPIHTGVSVKALRASYCSLVSLSDSKVSDYRRVFSSSDVSQPNSTRSSFSKFDQLSKKTVLHVRSVDAAKVQKQFNESASASPEVQSNCKSCGKQVFVMEQIKAEKAVWHKNCFRCKECSKQLTVDTYSSNEGELYCKPHFRELFKPKAVVEDSPEPIRRRKPELIIRENQPLELPPDVVRASDKPDLGLEELSSLNVKSRFQVFEKADDVKSDDLEKSPSTVNVKRSPSILSKLAKFQAKGMDIGVTDESLNGIPYEESSTSSEEEDEDGEGEEENGDIVKSRKTRERPMSFSKMEDVKSRWETGSAAKKEERREERKQEIQSIRSRLFMGKQGKMKEMYEQAVKESEQPAARRGAEVRSEKAKSIKEKFERGETLVSDEEGDDVDSKKLKDDELGVFEAGISKKSRSLFMELDASAAKSALGSPAGRSTPKEGTKKREVVMNHQVSNEVVKASDKLEDVQAETADVSSKFKFFETYKAPEKQKKTFRITPPREGQAKTESPEREIYRDPNVVRSEDNVEDELQHSMTTSKMLSIFRQMEEKAQREDVPDGGPKPLKCFTPPPDYKPESGSSEEESSEEDEEEDDDEEEEDGVVRSTAKSEDEFLRAAKEAAKAKTLRAKFEHWEEQENNINSGGGNINPTLLDSEHESIESTKSLRARFESLRNEAETPKGKPRPKVNRFVEIQTSCAEFCDSCEKKVYPLEKVETGGKLFHKGCFRCMQCSCILRMESYTLNNGKLYCIPHFKQLFISKGNYDEGFGLDQHKRKWNSTLRENGDILYSGIDANGNSH